MGDVGDECVSIVAEDDTFELRGTNTGASACLARIDGVERGWNEMVARDAFELDRTLERDVPESFRAECASVLFVSTRVDGTASSPAFIAQSRAQRR